MNPLKLAVAGCGQLARQVHLPVLAGLPGVQVIALIDPDASSRALAAAFHPEARHFAQLADLWDAAEPGGVIISAPTASHAKLTIEALRHGKHVYLEKPLAANMEDAAAILSAWTPTSQVAMIGFNYRTHRLFQSARRLLTEGAIGAPLMISTVFTTSMSAQNNWRGDGIGGGGVLLDLGSHHVDLIHFLLGERVVAASARTSSAHSDGGTATLQLQLESGLIASCAFSFGTVDQDRIEIFGDRALLRIDRNLSSDCEIIPAARQHARWRQLTAAVSFLRRPAEILAKRRAPGHELSYRTSMQRFVEAARNGSPATPDLHDGYDALAVLCAAAQSASHGSWMDVQAFQGAV